MATSALPAPHAVHHHHHRQHPHPQLFAFDPNHTPQQLQQIDAFTRAHRSTGIPDSASVPIEERKFAAQLAPLASQHHTSEYNKIKFGDRGAPAIYIPLGIQLPSHIRDLRQRQAINELKQAFFPASPPSPSPHSSSSAVLLPVTSSNPAALPEATLTTTADINNDGVNNGMVLDATQPQPQLEPPPKTAHIVDPIDTNSRPPTSGSHSATRISPDITLYAFSTVSKNSKKRACPTLTSPYADTLCEELSIAMTSPLFHPRAPKEPWNHLNNPNIPKTSQTHPINISQILPPEFVPIISARLMPCRSAGMGAGSGIMFDVEQGWTLECLLGGTNANRSAHGHGNGYGGTGAGNDARLRNFWNGYAEFGAAVKGSGNGSHQGRTTSILSISKPLQPDVPIDATQPTTTPNPIPAPIPHAQLTAATITTTITAPAPVPASPTTIPLPPSPPQSSPQPLTIGNLYLSSCPGKKVRLTGPVKGRGAICRDLKCDLERVKEVGVGCIVCCLDDDELSFLGAPWDAYESTASAVGLDVLRLPMPEGLGPLSPAAVNAHLEFLIGRYTVRGQHLLVHCRGGVGRAGLFACCWILKMGLCGRLGGDGERGSGNGGPGSRSTSRNSDGSGSSSSPGSNGGSGPSGAMMGAQRDAMELVERVVRVVRRRRSLKAIETYEQVRFLIDFVEFLRAGEGGGREGDGDGSGGDGNGSGGDGDSEGALVQLFYTSSYYVAHSCAWILDSPGEIGSRTMGRWERGKPCATGGNTVLLLDNTNRSSGSSPMAFVQGYGVTLAKLEQIYGRKLTSDQRLLIAEDILSRVDRSINQVVIGRSEDRDLPIIVFALEEDDDRGKLVEGLRNIPPPDPSLRGCHRALEPGVWEVL
ncbi:hypothetical protein BOTBODRAFT_40259 [Botryobasidium botryosum FD-172 SS1]|uniref:Tyrosine specific protein phosphatases domain-containing protein n=1 Tax=Botryobasidium botryosum (strain FD-172 SS1) TaxID=930990 RepID=A0A067N3E5_BOTB1|nr:hypothetical protein BOTBODRAFT_40259 [Botryobasidium botryosum FD-172 SS1]